MTGKTFYGLRRSPRAFWEFLIEKLKNCELKQSKFDPYLFVKEKLLCIIYIDDIIFWAKNKNDIHEIAIRLQKKVGIVVVYISLLIYCNHCNMYCRGSGTLQYILHRSRHIVKIIDIQNRVTTTLEYLSPKL